MEKSVWVGGGFLFFPPLIYSRPLTGAFTGKIEKLSDSCRAVFSLFP